MNCLDEGEVGRAPESTARGILYTTFHFPEHLVNVVTSSECDEDTMCPEYKVVAVDVERVGAPVEKKSAQQERAAAR
jgi:formate dehydrogenase major subunit